MDETENDGVASRRARLRARRRARKYGPQPMVVSGKSVFLLKQLIQARARAARRRGRKKR